MSRLKLTSWNVEQLDRLTRPDLSAAKLRRRDAVVEEIHRINPDILCLLEGPRGESAIDQVSADLLGGEWLPIKAHDGEYATRGSQWIWFLVRRELHSSASLLPPSTWDALTEPTWICHYWGESAESRHRHYRHPQVLVLELADSFRVEFIGLHLKSKYVNQGRRKWEAGGEAQEEFIREALKARVKMTTEASNVRAYIDAKFRQVPNPAIFVLGDLNDGPGKEWFEQRYLFFDLISNIQGDIFAARRYLNHALFDFPEKLRWSVYFEDFVDENRDPHILLDHILFTQGLVDDSLPWRIDANAGKVEHEVHELVNASLPQSSRTSDHRAVSVEITVKP